MKNSEESIFSVNVGLSDVELFELKVLVNNFIKTKATEKITQHHQNKSSVKLEKSFKVGDPTREELREVLELIEGMSEPRNDDINRNVTSITLSLPLW